MSDRERSTLRYILSRMESMLRDDHLIALYREDVKTIRSVKSA